MKPRPQSPDAALEAAAREHFDGAGKKRGGPSDNELAYGLHLELLKGAGEVRFYEPQPKAINLAHRCDYTPDYEVAFSDPVRPWEFVEVKGRKGKRPWYRDDGARVKTKVAARVVAQKYPGHIVVVVWPKAKKDGGGWYREIVRP